VFYTTRQPLECAKKKQITKMKNATEKCYNKNKKQQQNNNNTDVKT